MSLDGRKARRPQHSLGQLGDPVIAINQAAPPWLDAGLQHGKRGAYRFCIGAFPKGQRLRQVMHHLSRHGDVLRKGSVKGNSEELVVRAAFLHAAGASDARSTGDRRHHDDPVSGGKLVIAPPVRGDNTCKLVPENHGVSG